MKTNYWNIFICSSNDTQPKTLGSHRSLISHNWKAKLLLSKMWWSSEEAIVQSFSGLKLAFSDQSNHHWKHHEGIFKPKSSWKNRESVCGNVKLFSVSLKNSASVAKTRKIGSWLGCLCCSLTSTFLAMLWFWWQLRLNKKTDGKNKNKKETERKNGKNLNRAEWGGKGAYVCTLPAGHRCSYGCCLFWCDLWLDDQKIPQTPPERWDKTKVSY